MLSASQFRDLVSGERTGLIAALLRSGLRLLEFPYTWVVGWRNRQFDRRADQVSSVDVPVVSVGNLSMGGTGKTPMVEWIAGKFRAQDRRVVLVSRGYGTEAGKPNDEALELQLALPEVPHLQNPDRVSAAQQAITQHAAELILLDDGFQHRRLGRDLDIVLLDASEPFGYEHVFPRGMLREPVEGLSRADAVVLSRADMIGRTERKAIRKRVAELAPNASWAEVVHRPTTLINLEGQSRPIAELDGKQVAAFCGIGNPAGFQHTLTSLGCHLVAWHEFPDHHDYDLSDVENLKKLAVQAARLVCTRKDLVKLREFDLSDVELWAVSINLEFLAGEEGLLELIQRVGISE